MTADLIVRHPRGRTAERAYVYRQVLGDWLGLDVRCEAEDRDDVLLQCPAAGDAVDVRVCDGLLGEGPERWLRPDSVPQGAPVPLVGSRHLAGALLESDTVLPWAPPHRPCEVAYRAEGSIDIGGDLFGATFFFLTRYEEVAAPAADVFGRFPAASSWAVRHDLIERPLVDEYLAVIRAALTRAWPRLILRQPEPRVIVSHDVDLPLRYRWSGAARTFAGGLRDWIGGGQTHMLSRRMSDWYAVRHRAEFARDPYNTFDRLAASSERRGAPSAFYFIAERTSKQRDGLYEIDDPFIAELLGRLGRAGQEIGLHPSFETWLDAAQTRRELDRLVTVCHRQGVRPERVGGRQHYLRWRAPTTWLNWESAGLSYDSSVGFAERAGFRAGTAREFRAFDVHAARTLSLLERPLVVMDSTLLDYMKLGPSDAAIALGRTLRARCLALGGNFSVLWHNSNLTTPAHWRVFQALVEA